MQQLFKFRKQNVENVLFRSSFSLTYLESVIETVLAGEITYREDGGWPNGLARSLLVQKIESQKEPPLAAREYIPPVRACSEGTWRLIMRLSALIECRLLASAEVFGGPFTSVSDSSFIFASAAQKVESRRKGSKRRRT
jgi:hypothetical protein